MPIDTLLFSFSCVCLLTAVSCGRPRIDETPNVALRQPISRPTSPHLAQFRAPINPHLVQQREHVPKRFVDSRDDPHPHSELNLSEDELFDRMEFTRIQARKKDEVHKYEKRQYSTIPRQFECYSCMSLSYQENWEHLQFMYTTPKVFTNRCNDPFMQRNIPTVLCGSFCASLLEPNLEGGVFLGYKYIRGCVDRILRHGFNQSALRTHRFNQVDQCRNLPRAQLFNPPKGMDMPFFGDVQLCSCYGDKCNGASSARSHADLITAATVFVLLRVCLSLLQVPHLNAVPLINR